MVERPLRERVVVGSNPGCAIPKALKMVPVATLLGAQHYKQALAPLLLTTNIAQKLTKKTNPSTWFLGTRLMSPSGVKTYRKKKKKKRGQTYRHHAMVMSLCVTRRTCTPGLTLVVEIGGFAGIFQ